MAIGVDGVVGAAALRLVIKEDKQGFNSFDNFVFQSNRISLNQHFSVEFFEKINKLFFLKRSAIWSENFAFIRCRHATYLQKFWIFFW